MTGEKKHDPSSRRLQEARRKGDVALSREASSGVVVIVGIVVLPSILADLPQVFGRMWQAVLAVVGSERPDLAGVASVAMACGIDAMGLLARFLVPILIAAVVASFAQVGVLFVPGRLAPKLQNFDPMRRLKEMFSRKNLMMQLRTLLLTAVVTVVLWSVVGGKGATMLAAAGTSGGREGAQLTLQLAGEVANTLVWSFVAVLGLLAAVDYAVQWRAHRSKLRMTDQEQRQEHKQSEGSPEIKQARRRLHRELLEQSMLRAVESGDVVAVNPTHIACVLRYDPARESAPRILAIGEGHLAARIREAARHARVPIVRNIPLARALRHLPVDSLVPSELHQAAATVFSWAGELLIARGRTPQWQAGVSK